MDLVANALQQKHFAPQTSSPNDFAPFRSLPQSFEITPELSLAGPAPIGGKSDGAAPGGIICALRDARALAKVRYNKRWRGRGCLKVHQH